MRSIVRRAAFVALQDLQGGLKVSTGRFASTFAATSAAPREEPREAREEETPRTGDPGPSTLRNAKAQRRRLHAQLMSFSESAKESSVNLETFNDILAGSKARSPSSEPAKLEDAASPRPHADARARVRPTLSDSPFALRRHDELNIEDDEEGFFPERSLSPPRRPRYSVAKMNSKRSIDDTWNGGDRRSRALSAERGSDVTFQRIKDGPYALSGRIKKWIQNHPSPLSTSQVEELISMVSEAPKGDVNEVVWGQVFAVLGREKKLDRMWRAYNDMKKKGIKPNSRTYTTLLNAFASVPHSSSPVNAAFEPVPEGRTLSRVSIIYQQSQEHSSRLRPIGDPTADSGLAYPTPGVVEDADQEGGIQATNAYLKFLARYGLYAEAESVFQGLMKDEGGDLRPDATTFTTLFSALLNAHHRQAQAIKSAKWSSARAPSTSKRVDSKSSERRSTMEPSKHNMREAAPLRPERPDRSHRMSPIQIKRQFPHANRFEHRPKPSGFGLRKDPAPSDARAYSTAAQPATSTAVTFDSLMEHVKSQGLTGLSSTDQSHPDEPRPLHRSPHDSPRQGRSPSFERRSNRYDPFPTTANTSRAPRLVPRSRAPRGAMTHFPEAQANPASTATPSPIEIGRKARWLWSEALSILVPQTSTNCATSDERSALDDAVAIPAIQCLLRGRPEDQRYAIALIPRLFNLPALPSSSPPSPTEDLPEILPTLELSPIGATVLVSSLSRANRPTLATHYATIFLSARKWSSELDMAFYAAMIRALADTGDVHPILQILESSGPSAARKTWRWPVYVYCEALTAARWAGDWEAAKRAWSMMEKHHSLAPNNSKGSSASEESGDAGVHKPTVSPRVDSKAMSLLLKVALAKGKKDVQEALEIYEKYGGDAYRFGGRIRAGKKDSLVALTRKIRGQDPEKAEARVETAPKGGNAWSEELKVDVQRARELLQPRASPPV